MVDYYNFAEILSPFQLDIMLEVLTSAIKGRMGDGDCANGYDCIVYVEISKISIGKLLKLISEFTKITGKTAQNTKIKYICTYNKNLENKILKVVPFLTMK